MMRSKDLVQALAALANETRLAICKALLRMGPDGIPSHELADRMCLSRTLASHHLRILVQAGIVEQRRSGRVLRHSLVGPQVRALAEAIEKLAPTE